VGWDIDVDLIALQAVLLKELTVLLWGSYLRGMTLPAHNVCMTRRASLRARS
jgi:hypothetical protein